MADFEYCELSWSEGYGPQLTFYTPLGAERVVLEQKDFLTDGDDWETMQHIVSELGYNGWELISAAHHSPGLLFKRHLQ